MSQAGYTPIQLYYSTTAAAAPSAGNLAAGELAVNITDGKLFYKDNGGVVRVLATAAGSAGDVVGPGSSTDNALVRFDGTTGKLVQNSVGVLSDAGALSGLASVAATTFTGALTGNASTATTLQTSRTIWGQSFDGSANVTGALTGVTDLTASGSLTLNGGTANGVTYLNGSKVLTTGSALTFDGTNLGVANGSVTAGNSAVALTGRFSSGFPTSGAGYFQLQTNNSDGTNGGLSVFTLAGGALRASYRIVDESNAGGCFQAWNVAGSEQMRLTSTGLGIGTSSPVSGTKLTLQESASNPTALALLNRNSTQTWKIAVDAAAVDDKILAFIDNATSTVRLALTDSGNLGLGTTSFASQARLQIAGGRSYFGSNDSVYAVHVAYNNTRAQAGQGYYIGATDSAAPSLVFSNNDGTARTLIDSSGNVNFLAGNIYTQSTSGIFFTGTVGNFNNGIYGVGTNNVAISAGGSERARIDSSGNLLVGTTSADPISAQVNGLSIRGAVGDILASAGDTPVLQIARRGSDGGVIQFYKNTTAVGSVSTTSVLTTYNTTSDYRLKTVLGPVSDAGSRIDALEPVEYEWKSEGSRTRGFLAHKFQEVYPSSVTGTKDAVDEKGKPVYQSMQASSSEVIADLVAEIQSLRKRLAAAGI